LRLKEKGDVEADVRAVVQRVSRAEVEACGRLVGEIRKGLLVLVGVADGDTHKDVEWLAEKVATLRVFEDEDGKMNLSVKDVGGSVLAVSQFTLLGDCRKGRRPSFDKAAKPEEAELFYRSFVEHLKSKGLSVEVGAFRAHMNVSLVNDGPVTLVLDSDRSSVTSHQSAARNSK
jgi:D-tyrosyl-tRNA(Tyr) deacylase